MEIRQGIKAFSDWPTIPQLYVKGEFVGGSDIMMEMYRGRRAAGQLAHRLRPTSIGGPRPFVIASPSPALQALGIKLREAIHGPECRPDCREAAVLAMASTFG